MTQSIGARPRVTTSALVKFTELEIRAWFIFPEAIERLVEPDAICTDMDRFLGPVHVKVGPNYYARLEDVHEILKYTILEGTEQQSFKVVEIRRPRYMLLA